MSSSPPASAKWVGSTKGALVGSRLLTASIPTRSGEASQSCHSAASSVASQGWMSMSVSFFGCRAGGHHALEGSDLGSEPGEMRDQLVGGVVERLVGQRIE